MTPFILLYLWAYIGFESQLKSFERLKIIIEKYYDETSKTRKGLDYSDVVIWGFVSLGTIKELNRAQGSNKFKDFLNDFWSKDRGIRIFGSLTAIFIFFSSLYFFIDTKGAKIQQLIKNEGEYEIQAYYNLPSIDTSWFEKSFSKNAPIRKRLIASLKQHKKDGLSLNKYEKALNKHHIDNIKVLKITNDTIKVETSEYWYLRWYKNNGSEPAGGYMTPNYYPQYYYLVKNSMGNWEIYDIEYFGIAF